MFGSDDPAEIKYYSAESPYSKTVLRQCERMDEHMYALLSARIVVDTAALSHFYEQDDRLKDQRRKRAERRFTRGSDELMNLFQLLPEAVGKEQKVEDIAAKLVEEDKKS